MRPINIGLIEILSAFVLHLSENVVKSRFRTMVTNNFCNYSGPLRSPKDLRIVLRAGKVEA